MTSNSFYEVDPAGGETGEISSAVPDHESASPVRSLVVVQSFLSQQEFPLSGRHVNEPHFSPNSRHNSAHAPALCTILPFRWVANIDPKRQRNKAIFYFLRFEKYFSLPVFFKTYFSQRDSFFSFTFSSGYSLTCSGIIYGDHSRNF